MDSIKMFCAVAAHHSVSKAAREHGVTQSAASQRLAALEKELGVQLIDRTKRPLELTAAGGLFHRGCRKILGQYEKLKKRITGEFLPQAGSELRGEVTIAAIYSSGIDLLNQVKADFERLHPQAAVTIHYQQPEQVYDEVRHGQCDMGILSYPARWPGVSSMRLRDEVMCLVVRAGHALAGWPVVRPGDLTGRDMVGFERSLPIGRHLHRYLREHGASPHVVSLFDNIDTIKTYVSETDAAAILPERTVAREAAAGVLATVALEPRVARPLAIVYDRQRQQGPLVKSFMEYLLNNQPKRTERAKPAPASGATA
jgi:DNA-binding transcriptional LysR family regulator